jgi:hypothetical protein
MKDLTFAEKDLHALLQALQTQPAPSQAENSPKLDMIIVITGQGIGHGNDHLGRILMKFFLQSLTACATKPRLIIFIGEGVLLACENSEVVSSMVVLQEQGVKILIEGTSVDYHRVEEKIRCGEVVSMLSICSEILNATRIIVF